MDSFPVYIKDKRIRSGLSLREVAARLEVSSTYYADVEKGRRYPMALEKLMRFGKITGMDQDEIHRMLDLAGKARGTIAPDLAAYIVSHPYISAALRIAHDAQADHTDWEYFTSMLLRKHNKPVQEV